MPLIGASMACIAAVVPIGDHGGDGFGDSLDDHTVGPAAESADDGKTAAVAGTDRSVNQGAGGCLSFFLI